MWIVVCWFTRWLTTTSASSLFDSPWVGWSVSNWGFKNFVGRKLIRWAPLKHTNEGYLHPSRLPHYTRYCLHCNINKTRRQFEWSSRIVMFIQNELKFIKAEVIIKRKLKMRGKTRVYSTSKSLKSASIIGLRNNDYRL